MTAIDVNREGGPHPGPPSVFDRNGYFHDKNLTVRDFDTEQRYVNQRRWFVNRVVFGSGVICGLEVTSNGGSLCVHPGVAMDGWGREIVVPDTHTVHADELRQRCQSSADDVFVVCIEFAECPWEPVRVSGLCHGEHPREHHNRIRDWYRVRLLDVEEYLACLPDHDHPACPLSRKDRTVHDYLCEALRTCPHHEPVRCVALAEIRLHIDEGDCLHVELENGCRLRRFVATNRLLFDLVDCYHGDLPHVSDISWRHGDRLPYWELPNELTVTFDQPIDPATLNHATVQISYTVLQAASGSRSERLVPIVISPESEDGSPATSLTMRLNDDWYKDEIAVDGTPRPPGYSEIANTVARRDEVLVQITLRAAHIVAASGKALDGDFIAGRLPSGNGTQGGDFTSHVWLTNE